MASENPERKRSCGCIPMVVLVAMYCLGLIGFDFGRHWGTWQAVVGMVAGVLLSGPVCGVLLALFAGIVFITDKLKR